jgi:hypothetical protein
MIRDDDEEAPLLPSSPRSTQRVTRRAKHINYTFMGKLTLIPVGVLFFGSGMGFLVFHSFSYDSRSWTLPPVPYLVAGLATVAVAVAFMLAMSFWLVLKINVSIDGDFITVRKRGLFRRVTHRFATSRSSFLYYRTHYDDSKAWLTLVVRENDVFYLLYSWKGSGNQRDRFFDLLTRLKAVLATYQPSSRLAANRNQRVLASEIISKDEVIVSCPFAARLGAIADTDSPGQAALFSPICIDDVESVDCDKFFNHFYAIGVRRAQQQQQQQKVT